MMVSEDGELHVRHLSSSFELMRAGVNRFFGKCWSKDYRIAPCAHSRRLLNHNYISTI
jgi:hypothetical protein